MGQTNSSAEGKGYDNTLDFAARFDYALHRFRLYSNGTNLGRDAEKLFHEVMAWLKHDLTNWDDKDFPVILKSL